MPAETSPPQKSSSLDAPSARSLALVSSVTALLRADEGISDVGPLTVATSPPSVRLSFLRKVYALLSLQLLLTISICLFFMFVPFVRATALRFSALIAIASTVGAFATLFALLVNDVQYPNNALLLFAFTLLEGTLLGTLCAAYAKQGLGFVVLEALVITLCVFAGISLYALVSSKDFSFMGGALYTALIALFACSVVNGVLGFTGHASWLFAFALAFGGSVLFSLFILYDSSLIINHFGPDDALPATIMLYTDILNLFLQMLALLSEANGR